MLRRNRAAISGVIAALLLSLVVQGFGTGRVSAATNPFAGMKWYADPQSPVQQQADKWRSTRPGDAALLDIVAKQQSVDWIGGWFDANTMAFYSAVKLVELALPVAVGGRVLSAITGTLTAVVLYALATRLLGRGAALVAALVLAVSPLHLWYSQEARMYAPSALLVALAALALVGFAQATGRRARRGWAAFYGVSVLLAMYIVYSAFYPLAAQIVVLGFLLRRQGRRIAPLAVALGVAVLGYLPWLPQVRAGVAGLAERSGALGPTPTRALDALLAVAGLGGVGQRGESFYPGLWESAPAWRGVALLLIAPALALGCAMLARRGALATLTTGALLVGTFVVAIVSSLYSPGFAPRTLLYATLGWALLAGAATLVRRPRWLLILARLSLVGLLLVSGVTLRAMATGAEKQQYRAAVEDATVAATFGLPVVAIGYMAPFFDAYAPGLRYEERPFLATLAADTGPAALWLSYGEDPWEDMPAVRANLAALGFARLAHREFGDNLSLDLFARRDASLGALVPLATDFDPAAGWHLPPSGAARTAAPGGTQLTLMADGTAVPRASLLTAGGGACSTPSMSRSARN